MGDVVGASAAEVCRRMGFGPNEVGNLARCIAVESDERSRWLSFTWQVGILDGPRADLDEELDADTFAEDVVAALEEQRGRSGVELPWVSSEP